ncbi:MAG: MJ0042-type zinc finger domain-containing protein [Rubripirellula sp.]
MRLFAEFPSLSRVAPSYSFGFLMPLSLECPHCQGAVSVADHAAGKRVKCPHCEKTFLAPGVAASSNDDDDWLKLDSDPAPAQPPTQAPPPKPTPTASKPKPPAQPPKKSTPGSVPTLSADDEALLAEFATDLDEFTAEIEAPPAPLASAPVAIPKGATPAASTPAPTTSVEFATEYRVSCKICGSLLYAKAAQAGKTVKCTDCHSPITIPPAPRVRKDTKVEMDSAPTFQLEDRAVHKRTDPYKKSASDLLEEASREETVTPAPSYTDTPDVKEWFRNVFGIFKDLGVLAHWGGLSTLASVAVCIALLGESKILIMGLFPVGFFLSVLTVCCGFAILQAVANNEDSITDWPTLDPFAWLDQLFVALAAAGVAAVPAWGICHFLIGPSLLSVAITMFSVFAIFPFVVLSMLDMNSAFVPFSSEVARSVTKCEEAWGGFYFSSAALFVGTFFTFALASSFGQPAASVVSIFVGVGAVFCYFSMIGRLAYAIGQAVNAPPMENDIDRSRPTDAY